MRCSTCGVENRETAKFCNGCAASLASKCPQCGATNLPSAKFCDECGASLTPLPKPSAPTSSFAVRVSPEIIDSSTAADGERKLVTALFADIKGSMELIEDLDPEEARAIVDPALKLMMDAVHRYGGYVTQSTGDGIFALFGAPIAHEDHPQRALFAALRMQEELKRYSDRIRSEGRLPIQVRVGVNAGEVVVRTIRTGDAHTEYAPIGHSISLASRMQTLAPIGSIATTDPVRKLGEGYFVFKSLGPTKVKGVSEPVEVYEVTGLGPIRTRLQRAAGRGYTKFVGRQREIDAMKHAAEQAKAGHGQIVAAVGEPGVGKSRLLSEFKAISQSQWMVLEAFSISHGKASAFLPVIDLLWSYFKITSEDDERTRREKVTGRVLALDRLLEDALPYLYGLLGLTDENNQIAEVEAQTRKRRALDAIKRILLRESLNQPLMVVFEDLHWVDEETQAFLNLLADSIGTARILMLVNYRPEYRHEWGHQTYYTQLRLDPLGKESADEMLSALLGDGAELGALKHLIIEKTGGNPFFIEEIVLALFDEGTLVRNGMVKLKRSLNQLKIPPTVQAVLAARIDRLVPDQKDLLQTLAAIGTEFELGLVREVSAKPGPELESMLSELQLGEFIYEQPAIGEIEYTFKHALTHAVAYNSMLTERRRLLHERIGIAIESVYGGRLDEHLAELTRHYARGGNPHKALEYCLRAVQQCAYRGSFAEAVAQFETGLELLQKLPDDDRRAEMELDLRNAVGEPLGVRKGYGSSEAEQSVARAMELCRRPGINWKKSWQALFRASNVHLSRPDMRKAEAIGVEMVARAEEQGSARLMVTAATTLATVRTFSGDFELAVEGFDRAWVLLESSAKPITGFTKARTNLRLTMLAYNRVCSAFNLALMGYPNQALVRINVATAAAQQCGSKSVLEDIHSYAASIYDVLREIELTRERAEMLLELATEMGDASVRAQSEIYLGWADALAGDLDGGLLRMRQHMSELQAIGSATGAAYNLAHIATVLSWKGQFDEGLRTLDEEAFPLIELSNERCHEAEVHRLKGELLLAQGASNAVQAEQSFRTAIEISRRQKAKSWELRASMSLARLLDKQGKRDEARAMLADIYNWFTEGLDTAYLKDAKALLEDLSA